MTSINPVYVVAPQQQSQKKRTAAHVGNAALATAGLGATGYAAGKLVKNANRVYWDEIAKSNDCKTIWKNFYGQGKLYKFFEVAGQKMFKPNSKMGQAIERFVTGKLKTGGHMCSPEQIAALVKRCKTFRALGVVAVPIVLGILGLATYKAGKING